MTSDPEPIGLETDLLAWGRTILLETRGRRSGRARRASLGFIEDDDGSLLVAANADTAHWARNLLADPYCHVERERVRAACLATLLDAATRDATVTALILKYGTPSERLGAGPGFRLRPIETQRWTERA